MAEDTPTQAKCAKKQSMIRLDIYVKRHPSLTSDEFHERWSKVHGSLLKGWLAEKGVYRYTQYHTPPELSAQALGVHDDAGILNFDGHAEVVVPDVGVMKKLVEDSFFDEFARPNQERLVDMGSVMRRVGYEEVYVENGTAV